MDTSKNMVPVVRNFIDGKWADSHDGATYTRLNPFDQTPIAIYQDSDVADAERAVQAARRAFDEGPWPRMTAVERATIFRRAATLLRERADSIATTMAKEVGQPKREQERAVLGAADTLEFYAGLIVSRRDESVYSQRSDAIGLVVKEPVGVIGSLTAWNTPLSIAHKACPGMAAGCTLIVKPAHQSAGAVTMLAQIFADAGLPPGVFNVVTSARQNGAVVGQALASSDMVDMVTFTGSSATGKVVMRAAAGNLKRVKLELGGKSPNVVFADTTSIDAAVASAATGITRLAGQSCQAGSRLLLEDSIKDEFMEKLRWTIGQTKLGNPLDPETTCGPLVSEEQLQRVEYYADVGRLSGRMLIGGDRPTDPALSNGWFYNPTVIDQLDPTARIAQEEVFGPVLSVLTFKDADDAIRIANSTIFGLVAGCWTSNLNTAMKFARQVKAGGIWVNSYRDDAVLKYMPQGGFKQSGIGREVGEEGLDAFLETKSIMIKLT